MDIADVKSFIIQSRQIIDTFSDIHFICFFPMLSLIQGLVFVHLFLQVACANDGFRVEANGSLPSSARQIQSIRGIAYAWIRACCSNSITLSRKFLSFNYPTSLFHQLSHIVLLLH